MYTYKEVKAVLGSEVLAKLRKEFGNDKARILREARKIRGRIMRSNQRQKEQALLGQGRLF